MIPSETEQGLWVSELTIGIQGEESFMIARDHDMNQLVHPMESSPADGVGIVVGPDDQSSGPPWLIRGNPNDTVVIQLSMINGDIEVKMVSEVEGECVWRNIPHEYFILGSFNYWGYSAMEADENDPGIYRGWLTIGELCYEEFQISLWQNCQRMLYPIFPNAVPGTALVCGPDEHGYGLHWEVAGAPGQMMEVTLNMNAEDKRSVVTCMPSNL